VTKAVLKQHGPTNLTELFWVNTKLALRGFGGVLPLAHRVYVEEQGWLDETEFTQMIALAQVAPGPNVVNLSIALGDRYFGTRGAVISCLGMLAIPMLVIVALAWLYSSAGQSRWFRAAMDGMTPVAAGLILAMGYKLVANLFKSDERIAWHRFIWLGLAMATALAMVVLHWPILWVVLGFGSLGVCFAWFFGRPKNDRPS
jgi:chromate transporter